MVNGQMWYKIAISYLMGHPQLATSICSIPTPLLNGEEVKNEKNRDGSNKPKGPIRIEPFALFIDALCSRCLCYFNWRKDGH